MSADCIEGCKVKGKHLPDCRDECDCRGRTEGKHRPKCGGTCRGCLPRPAEFGRLCAWGWQRLNADVVDAPALARYLWALAHSGEASMAELKVQGGDPAEQEVLHAALDALDGLHACLASWAHLVLEGHPDGPQMRGPDEAGAWRTHTVAVLDSAIAREYGPYLRKSQIAGVHDPDATSRLVRWMLPKLRWCSEQEWAGEMRREVAETVRTTAARFPVAERTRAIPGVTCPVCERVSLAFDPTTPERPTSQVNCTTRGCGVVFTEDEFKRLTGIVEWEHRQDEREKMGA